MPTSGFQTISLPQSTLYIAVSDPYSSMQETTFREIEPSQAALDLNQCHPTLVVWPCPPPPSLGPGSEIPDESPKPYPLQDGEATVARWMGTSPTVHVETTDDPEGVFKRGSPSNNAHFHPPKSEIRFYPKGVHSRKYFPIVGSTCVFKRGESSYLCRENGGTQGPYPCHSSLSTLPPLTQTSANQSWTSQVSSRPHSSFQDPASSDYAAHVPLRDADFLNGDSADGDVDFNKFINQEMHDNLVSLQTPNDEYLN
jgi:hypothetical protein